MGWGKAQGRGLESVSLAPKAVALAGAEPWRGRWVCQPGSILPSPRGVLAPLSWLVWVAPEAHAETKIHLEDDPGNTLAVGERDGKGRGPLWADLAKMPLDRLWGWDVDLPTSSPSPARLLWARIPQHIGLQKRSHLR